MPRVPRRLLDAVAYIYPTTEAANDGTPGGSTGFLISVSFESPQFPNLAHLYLVTNAHCVTPEPSVAVRFNTKSGGTEVVAINRDQWIFHPEGDDIAAVAIDLDQAIYRLSDVPAEILMTEEQRNADFGVGDECFVIGRNVGLEGKRTNTPTARFGAVSMMAPEPVYQPLRARAQDSIVVEAKSLGGYSGAPAFVHQSPPITEPVRKGMERWPVVVQSYSQSGFAMLGVTWGHINGPAVIEGPAHDLPKSERALLVNSGMMLVVPAWKIRELLDVDILASARRSDEQECEKLANESSAVLDSGEVPRTQEP